jgi:hypothetical protein
VNIDPARVRAWGEITAEDGTIIPVIAAVEELLADDYDVPDPVPERVKLAETMQVSRLLKRRKTPEGVAQFGSELALRVDRFDRDIDMLLRSCEPARLGEG